MKKQTTTIMANLFNYIRIVIIILFILITGYPDNAAIQGQTIDIGEGYSISSKKPGGIYIPLTTAFTDVKRAVLRMPSPDHRFIHSSDGRIVASASVAEPGKIMIWNTVTGASLEIQPAEFTKAWDLISNGKILVTGGDRDITLWDTSTGLVLKVLKGVTLYGTFAFSPDGKILATANNKKVIIRNVETNSIIKEIKRVPVKFDLLSLLSFSIDGRILVLQNRLSSVIIWDTATWNKIEFKGDNNVVFSPDGRKETTPRYVFEEIDDVVFSPDGRFFGIIKFLKKSVYFFNAKTWSKVATITARDVSFSPDGKILAATDGDSVTLWDTETWHRLRTFATNNCQEISSIAFSPDNRTIVTGYSDNVIVIWDSVSGNRIKILAPEYDGYISNIFFSPDGRKFFTYSDEPAPPPPPSPEKKGFTPLESPLETNTDHFIDDLGLGLRECLPLETSPESDIPPPPKKKYSEDSEPIKVWNLPDFYVTEQFNKDEFESVREFSERVKMLEVPFSSPVNLRGYDAEKLGFHAELGGKEIFIPTPKEKARELALNKENVLLTGGLRYFNSEKLEIVNAVLTAVAPQSAAYVYKTSGTYVTATTPVESIAEAVHRLNISAANEHKDYFAVVIGIEKYRDIKSDAMYAVKDAEWVREYLIKGVGIPKANISTLINENATKGDIEKTVEVWLRNKVKGSNSSVAFR